MNTGARVNVEDSDRVSSLDAGPIQMENVCCKNAVWYANS